MAEYDDVIRRQSALDALGKRPIVWLKNLDYSLGGRTQYDMDRLAIETVPSVDAVPVKHGWWKRNKNGTYSCSECQSWIPNEQKHYANFCLYCGARMDKEENNERSSGEVNARSISQTV